MRKLVVITGGTKGIGRAIAERFAAEGFDLFVTARTEKYLDELKISIEAKHAVKCHVFSGNIGDKSDVRELAKGILQLNQAVEVLVNNAGLYRAGLLADEPDNTLEKLIEINLYGAYYLTKELLPNFTERRTGHIFNICSVASISTPENSGSYTISKFALLGFNKVLREEMKPHNVRVTAVLPGATLTDSWKDEDVPPEILMPPEDIAAAVWNAYAMKNSVVEEIVLQPMG
jgi:short-subunit dehydrogenase